MLRRSVRALSAMRASPIALGAIALLALPGCEYVLGMNGHDAVLVTSDAAGDSTVDGTVDSGTDAGNDLGIDTGGDLGSDVADVADTLEAETPATPCVLPTTGDANARFSNMTASTQRVDLCLLPSGGGTAIGPIFETSGTLCPNGIGYKDSTASFAVASGSYNAVFIAAGGACTDTPIAQTNVSLVKDAPVNVVLTGDGLTASTARSFVETVPDGLHFDFRFIHAVAGGPGYDFGITAGAALPTTLSSVVGTDLTFGQTLPAGAVTGVGTTDANGYVTEQGSLQFGFGIAKTGTAPVLAITNFSLNAGSGYTFYAVGRIADPTFPLELLGCNEKQVDGPLAECANSPPLQVSFAEFNAYLTGVFGPLDSLREAQVKNHLDQISGDVVCINEVYDETWKQGIIAAAGSTYSYIAEVPTDNTTVPEDPTDESGSVPAPFTTAACDDTTLSNGSALSAQMNAFVSCARDNCSTGAPGDDSATIFDNSADCISAHCTAQALPILTAGTFPAKRCYSCLLTHWFDRQSFASQRSDCTTVVASDPLTFGGNNGAIVLSKYPLDLANAHYFAVPSYEWRAGILYVPVKVSATKTVDFYCGDIDSPQTGITRPYAGQYGGTLPDGGVPPDFTAWENEHVLQIQKIIASIAKHSTSAGTPAVIAGDYYVGTAFPSATPPISALNQDGYTPLVSALPLGITASYSPTCTYCESNPLLTPPGTPPTGSNTWAELVLLAGIPVTDVRGNEIFATMPVIHYAGATGDAGTSDSGDAGVGDSASDSTVGDASADAEAGAATSYDVPLSPNYGFRSTILIRP